MKKTKTLALLLTIVLLVGLFAGCSGSSEASASPETTQSASPAAPPSQAQPSASEAPDANGEGALPEISLPLTKTTESFTFWLPIQPFMMTYNIDGDMLEYYKNMEKLTNVHMDVTAVSFLAVTEQFNLMVASGQYPDLISGFESNYARGADSAISDGIIVDLMPHMDTALPYYKAALNTAEKFWLYSLTPTGKVGSANDLFSVPEGFTAGALIRKDWLDKLNMEVPTTYDQLEAFLKAVKTDMGVGGSYLLYQAGVDDNEVLTAGYDTDGFTSSRSNPFLNINGKVQFAPTNDGYKEYLKMIHRWYDEGLVNPDYASISQRDHVNKVVAGDVAAWATSNQALDEVTLASDGAVQLVAMPSLGKTKGQTLHIGRSGFDFVYGVSLSTSCKNQELALQWLNFCYTDQATLIANYGVEGTTFEYDDEGKPYLTDFILKNPDYTIIGAIYVYTLYGGAQICNGQRYFSGWSQATREAVETWGSNIDLAYYIPQSYLAFTADSKTEYSMLMGDICTYVMEMTNRFVMGDLDIEAEWGNYIGTIDRMNIARAVQLEQEALDGYFAKADLIK